MNWQIEHLTRPFSPFFRVDWRGFCARCTLRWPPECTRTVRNNPLLEPSSQMRHPRFLTLALNSYVSLLDTFPTLRHID